MERSVFITANTCIAVPLHKPSLNDLKIALLELAVLGAVDKMFWMQM
jgi:hypothetical protein